MTASKPASRAVKKKKSGSSKTTSNNLKAVSSSADGVDGRIDSRIPIQLLVDYKANGHYLFDFCRDLGAGGVFIQTPKPLPAGSEIDLTFTIPDSKDTLTTKGTVIWVQPPVSERADLIPGMGVQFAGFSNEQRQLLDDFVQRYHGTRFLAPEGKENNKAG